MVWWITKVLAAASSCRLDLGGGHTSSAACSEAASGALCCACGGKKRTSAQGFLPGISVPRALKWLWVAKLVLMPRPLRLPEPLLGREAAPCPARPPPMAIGAIPTESRRPDGQAAA